jgi:glycosyltransferase involved in cell wall biosynthesis
MKPLISLVTGTHNRITSLIRMIESARRAIPRGLPYEIIVVDGKSEDNTHSWCESQGDIRLIKHGALLGAIRAFCDGAKSAQADYVILANDDVVFKPYSILAALAHLEQTPSCGAVAFADNRTSLMRGDGNQYRTEGIGATLPNGQRTMVTYAQVGMIRRELGNAVGWWGADDPIMCKARTYGGDCFLSAGIWERGFTVDAVPQAEVQDFIQNDDLRSVNAVIGPKDSSLYYTRYPTVHLPAVFNRFSVKDRLRILHVPVYEQGFPGKMNLERGLTEALASYGLACEWDYLNESGDLVEYVKAWQPDLLITQIQNAGERMTPFMLASARNACPSMLVVNFNGDIHLEGLTGSGVLDLLQYVDLQTTVNARVLPVYRDNNINAAFWEIYWKEALEPLPAAPAYDVLFQGNCYNKQRDALVKTLKSVKAKVGIYGNCPGSNGNTHYDFSMQAALYRNATINVGDTFSGGYAYVSNRLFQCLGAGGFLLQQHSDGLHELTGLTPSVHYMEWRNLGDLRQKIAEWLAPEKEDQRNAIAQAGMAFVRKNYSVDAQVHKLFSDLLPLIEVKQYATA